MKLTSMDTPDPSQTPDTSASSTDQSPIAESRAVELLAPAGDWAALVASLDAGADAVYLGLTILNARRRARNFDQADLPKAVQMIHQRGARAYLTLNIDFRERDLAQVARALQLAEEAEVDAVLVRDPAVLALKPEFPSLEIHFSTQAGVANSADVAAAAKLGATRVVLARELSLDEIRAASAASNIETEVFVQGALCFCVSGRCMLSSWAGGRSGNRGMCTSPCRVPWSVDGQPSGTPLSMHDLAAVERLRELCLSGVKGLKIEGRMKTADWVSRAVGLYRRALDGEDVGRQLVEVEELGAYTGRQMTSGYLDGDLHNLTGAAGRERQASSPENGDAENPENETAATSGAQADLTTYQVEIDTTQKQLQITCRFAGETATWSMPKTVVRRKHKAVTIGKLFDWLAARQMQGCQLSRCASDDPEFLMVPRRVNELVGLLNKFIQHRQKVQKRLEKTALPDSVASILEDYTRCPSNQLIMGQPPDRVRLDARAVEQFLSQVQPGGAIVEGVTADRLKAIRAACGRVPLIVALPPVFFEESIRDVKKLLRQCARMGVTVEVNSWGGWSLAKAAGVQMESGPFLPVLNSLAGKVLGSRQIGCVTLSVEADRRQLQDVTANCPVPCSLIVFGRPALMITRVELPDDYEGTVLVDRRDIHVTPRRENGLWVLRPTEPFDLRGETIEQICVKHLVVDLVSSPDPVKEWIGPRSRRHKAAFRFNFDRRLA